MVVVVDELKAYNPNVTVIVVRYLGSLLYYGEHQAGEQKPQYNPFDRNLN